MLDQPIEIRVSGLRPGEAVTLSAEQYVGPQPFRSHATFQADHDGAVDPGRRAPQSGSYSGVEPMGLLWSMDPVSDPSQARGFGSELRIRVVRDGSCVADETVHRFMGLARTERISIAEAGVHGELLLPPRPGPHPLVVCLTGSGGGIDRMRAGLLAARGYACLALAYFGYGPLPRRLVEIPLEYFGNAFEWAARDARLDSSRLAVVGGSRGGELALLLAATFPRIRVAIAYAPSHVRWGGFPSRRQRPAWTQGGQPLPYLKARAEQAAELLEARTSRERFEKVLASASHAELEAARIPIERSSAALLLVSGGQDAVCPSDLFAEQAMRRLHESGYPHTRVHLRYPDAGHAIGTPHIPRPTATVHPLTGQLVSLGGARAANERASVDSWPRVLDFLATHL